MADEFEPPKLNPYRPTFRDRIAQWLIGDEKPSPERIKAVEGLVGSKGLGGTGMSLVDATPLGLPLALNDARGDVHQAAIAMAVPPPLRPLLPVAGAASRVAREIGAEAAPVGIRAFHGSPHEFDRFALDKIGTGEGAQAYGHGLYSAENEAVARGYRDALSDPANVPLHFKGQPVNTPWNAEITERWKDVTKGMNEKQLDDFTYLLGNISQVNSLQDVKQALYGMTPSQKQMYEKLVKPELVKPPVSAGHMYEINIKTDPLKMADWDKPLSLQTPEVKEALYKVVGAELPNKVVQGKNGRWVTMRDDTVVGRPDGWPDKGTAEDVLRIAKEQSLPNQTFGEFYKRMNATPATTSEKLRQAGIPGIKYLDQGSRPSALAQQFIDGAGGSKEKALETARSRLKNAQFGDLTYWDNVVKELEQAQKQSSNFVVFDDNLIEIIKKYGIAGLAVLPPATSAAVRSQMQPVDHDPFKKDF